MSSITTDEETMALNALVALAVRSRRTTIDSPRGTEEDQAEDDDQRIGQVQGIQRHFELVVDLAEKWRCGKTSVSVRYQPLPS